MAVCCTLSSVYPVFDLHERGVATNDKEPDSDFDLSTLQQSLVSYYALLSLGLPVEETGKKCHFHRLHRCQSICHYARLCVFTVSVIISSDNSIIIIKCQSCNQ